MIKPSQTKVAYVRTDGSIVTGTLANLFPRTSFSKPLTVEECEQQWGCYPIDSKSVGTNQVSVPTDPYLQDGIVYNNQVRNTTLAERKVAKTNALRQQFNAAINKGITVGSTNFKTDLRGQQEISQLADMVGRSGGTQKFVTRGGKVVETDAATAVSIRNAVEDYVSSVYENEANLQAQIDACTTLTQINAVDVTSGWPT